MKLGIIIDSSSGWTKKQADKKKWFYIPLHVSIDDKEYLDGVDLDDEIFYSIISINSKVSTSCTSPNVIENVFKKLTKKFDEVIYLPLSYKLSSHNETCIHISKNFKNIHVLKSKVIGVTIPLLMEEAISMAKLGVGIKEIIQRIELANNNCLSMILPVNMDWLKKGGRVSKSTAMLGNLLSIIPILYFDGAIEKWGKGRSFFKSMIKATKGLQEILKDSNDDYNYILLYTHNQKNAYDLKKDEKLKTLLKKCVGAKVGMSRMPRLLIPHVGLGTYSITALPKKI